MSIVERLGIAVKMLNLKTTMVSRKTGINYDTCRQIINGRSGAMRTDLLEVFVKTFPQLSADYILRGEGNPLRSTKPTSEEQFRATLRSIRDQASDALGERG